MNKSKYNQIIDIITNPDTDYKTIAMEVARQYPTIFLKCSGAKDEPKHENSTPHGSTYRDGFKVNEAIIDFIRRGRIVLAIKEYRTLTGLGLKESKDAINSLKNTMKQNGEI